ncbi:MAG: DNA/RNA non-specific endonuclease [Ferruginibacter sp.]
MRKFLLCSIVSLCISVTNAQSIENRITEATAALKKTEQQRKEALDRLEDLRLEKIRVDLQTIGLPAVPAGEQLIQHLAYFVDFAPAYRQPRWVAHIITPEVISGIVFRTNDFRPDSAVTGGSAVEEDFFLKKLKPDSSYEYDAFGFDRGHMAPSADFRWSQKALSESYLYSNISPQVAELNRGTWGDMEDVIRGYLYRNPSAQLYVVTGPVLKPGLPVIKRGKNKLPVPEFYWKVVMDPANKKSIGFVMPNRAVTEPVKTFAVSVDKVEELTGMNFFNKLPVDMQATTEAQLNTADWITETNSSDVAAIPQETLPRNHFNTEVAKQYTKSNTEINVCGTVVGARLSRAGNILINLDKQFPNQVFTVFIKKENIANFSYKPEEMLKGKKICVKGKVIDLGGTVTMYIDSERELKIQ